MVVATAGADIALETTKFCCEDDGCCARVDDDDGSGTSSDTALRCASMLLRSDPRSLSHFSCCDFRQSPCCCCCCCRLRCSESGLLIIVADDDDDDEELLDAAALSDPSLCPWPLNLVVVTNGFQRFFIRSLALSFMSSIAPFLLQTKQKYTFPDNNKPRTHTHKISPTNNRPNLASSTTTTTLQAAHCRFLSQPKTDVVKQSTAVTPKKLSLSLSLSLSLRSFQATEQNKSSSATAST